MIVITDFDKCKLVGLNEEILKEISLWKYEKPYNIYNLELNEYLKDSNTWGKEQFVLVEEEHIIAYVACQIIDENMWVGWSLRPDLCGKGTGVDFVKVCIDELVDLNKYYDKEVFLKVVNWNTRAIKAYEKSGFAHHDKLTRYEEKKLTEYIIMKM